jgi:hypothetical protein
MAKSTTPYVQREEGWCQIQWNEANKNEALMKEPYFSLSIWAKPTRSSTTATTFTFFPKF